MQYRTDDKKIGTPLLSNKFLKYKVEWNVIKMNRNGKNESEVLHYFF